ncbi:MAG: FtsX-like permease family protein [Leifsonia sp.]
MSLRTTALLARHLRAHPGGAILLGAVVLLLSALATAAPRAAVALHTSALQVDVAALEPADRDLGGGVIGIPELGASGIAQSRLDDEAEPVWGAFDDTFSALRAELPPALRAAAGQPEYLLALDGVPIEYPGTGPHGMLSFAFDPRASTRIEMQDGRAPAVREDGAIEVSLATANATALGWPVGEQRVVDLGDGRSTTVILSGTFEPRDPDDGYWSHAPLLLEPSIYDDGLSPPVYTGTGLVNPAALPVLDAMHAPPRLSAWFPLRIENLDAETAPDLLTQMRRQGSTETGIMGVREGFRPAPLLLSSRATTAITASLERSAALDAVLAMTASAPIGVALAVLVLGGRILFTRRVDALRLLGSRGASPAQLRSIMAIEGLLVGVPAAAIGATIGVLATAAIPLGWELAVAVVVGLLPAIILAILAAPGIGRVERSDAGGRAGSPVRLIVEAVVVGLTVIATVLLVQRGGGAGPGLDLLTVGVPLLLSLSACIIALRLYPLPLRRLVRRSTQRRGLASLLGPARALRDPSAGLAPVFALAVGAAVAASSAVLLSTIGAGIDDAAHAAVGADVRVSGISLTAEQAEQIGALPGVVASAPASDAASEFIDADGRQIKTSVIVTDAAALAAVQRDVPGALPAGLIAEDSGGLRAIVSASVAEAIGGAEQPLLDGDPVDIVAVVDGATPLGSWEDWVVIDSRDSRAVTGRTPSTDVLLLRVEEGTDIGALGDAVHGIAGENAELQTPADVRVLRSDSPAVSALRVELIGSIVVAAALSALVVAMTLVLGAPSRARLFTLLQVLGAPRRSGRWLLLWEVVPPAAAAVLVGGLLGLGLPLIVISGVDLRTFTGGRAQPGLVIDPLLAVTAISVFVVVTAGILAVAYRATRRVHTDSVLRTVEGT